MDVREEKKNGKELEGSEGTKDEKESKAAPKATDERSSEKAKKASPAAEEAEDEDEDEDGEDENDEDDGGKASRAEARALAREESRKRDARDAPGEFGYAVGSGSAPIWNTWIILRRELKSYFDSLVAYVVLGGSMLGIGIWFFLMQEHSFWDIDRAGMARMFDAVPWALSALVIPLVTMRSLAEEKRTGTLELLITLPIRDSEVIMGKYLAAFAMTLILFAATIIYPLTMFWWPWHLGPLDWGPVWGAYLGLVLFSAAATAVGMLYSSLTESQIIAFFLTAVTLLFLQIIGSVVEGVHGWLGDAIAFVSFQSRFAPFARGLIDTRAVLYFLSIAIICLIAAFRSLESRKWS
jgi:ABC-2 type transport system permease protein